MFVKVDMLEMYEQFVILLSYYNIQDLKDTSTDFKRLTGFTTTAEYNQAKLDGMML